SGCAVKRDQETAGVYVDDKIITSMITARHAQSQEVATSCITVETLYGVVLLSGYAKSPQEKITAQHIAGQVDGVKAIHNEIVIQPDHTGPHTVPSCRATSGFRI